MGSDKHARRVSSEKGRHPSEERSKTTSMLVIDQAMRAGDERVRRSSIEEGRHQACREVRSTTTRSRVIHQPMREGERYMRVVQPNEERSKTTSVRITLLRVKRGSDKRVVKREARLDDLYDTHNGVLFLINKSDYCASGRIVKCIESQQYNLARSHFSNENFASIFDHIQRK